MALLDNRGLHGALIAAALLAALLLPGQGALISLAVVVLTLIFVKSSRGPTLTMIWRSPMHSLGLGVGIGILTAIAFAYAIDPLLSDITGEPVDLSSFDAVEGKFGNFLVLMAVGLIFGGVFEEMIFRGFVIGWGSAIFGAWAALPLAVVSAAVFGFTHLYQGWAGVLSTGLIGLILGVTYVGCGRRLLPCIAAHMANNAVGITAIYLGMA